MKKTYLVSGLIVLAVSLTVVTGYDYFKRTTNEIASTTNVNYTKTVSAQKVLYAANDNGEIVPLDFTKTTDKVLDAMVNIQVKRKYANNRNGMY